MNKRVDIVLMWAIWVYTGLCVFSLINKIVDIGDEGLLNLVNTLTFTSCYEGGLIGYSGHVHCGGSYLEYLLLIMMVAARYILFGKTFHK